MKSAWSASATSLRKRVVKFLRKRLDRRRCGALRAARFGWCGLPCASLRHSSIVARRVADLQAHVPEHVEHVLGDALGERRLLVGAQEQQIEIGGRREFAAAVAADRDHREALALGRVAGAEDVGGREIVERADDLVGDLRQQPRDGEAVLAGLQPLLGDHSAPKQARLQKSLRTRARRALALAGAAARQLRAQPAPSTTCSMRAGFSRTRHMHCNFVSMLASRRHCVGLLT